LAGIKGVHVGFPKGLEASAWYLAAWAGHALHVTPTVAAGSAELRLELSGPDTHVQLERNADRLVTKVDGQSNCANLPVTSDYLLMREELAIMRRDPVFEHTLASAARLAVSSRYT
jgi:hypothetical protein